MGVQRITQGVKNLPRPRSWPIIGTLGALLAAGGAPYLHEYVDKRHKQLGPIYKEKIGPVTGVFVSSPDYMRKIFALEGRHPSHIIPESWALYNQLYGQKRGLLFMEGEEWHSFRKLLNPVILKPETSTIVKAVTVVAEDLIATWTKDGVTSDLEQQLYKWSLKSIIAVLLGAQPFRRHETSFSLLVDELSRGIHGIFIESAKLSLLPAKVAQQFRLPPWTRFVNTVDRTFNTAENLMEELKKITCDSTGLLKQLQGTGISSNDLNRIVMDLILAAGDTTAYTTQWLLYLLGKNPDIQQRLYEEIRNSNNLSTLDNQFLKGSLKETLRLYPVAPFITRYMPETVDLDGYCLEKGDLVIMSLFSSGRDETSFPQPLEFQPDRWIRNENGYKKVKNPQASIPFAMGARSCIGRKIAETQILTTAAMVLKKFEVGLQNKKNVSVILQMIAVPSTPIDLKLKRR